MAISFQLRSLCENCQILTVFWSSDLEMSRLAPKKLTAPDFADKLAFPSSDFSAHCDNVRPALDTESLEGVVIHIHLMRAR